MATSNDTPFLHEALAQYFSLDDLRLLCVNAGVDPDSVPFSERGKEIFAYCIVETFRKKNRLAVLIAECARSHDHVEWGACIISSTVPAGWAGLFAAQRAFDALHQLPSLPENFVGRQNEIDLLCASIRANANTGTPSAILSSIEGMGGVGKTALAIVAAHQLITDFPDAQLFIQLNANGIEPLSTAGAREQILHAYDPEAKLPDNETELASLYRSALANQCGLIIFDDARDDAHIKPLLPPAGWAVLITSRNTLATGKPLRLEALPRADAVTLLRDLASRITEPQAGDLADACGDLPVALRLVGADLKRFRTKSVDAFTSELRANRAGKLDLVTIFGHSFNRLHPRLQNALGALSVMPASFDRAAGEAVIDNAEHHDLLDDLVALNWLEYDETAERFNWHDLLREFVAGQTPAGTVQAAAFRHAQHFIQVAYKANNLYLAGNDSIMQGLALFDRERPHLIAAFAFLTIPDQSGDATTSASALNNLVDAVAYICELRFHPHEQIRWLEAQLAACRRIGNKHGEGIVLNNLGGAYADLGELLRAIKLYEQQLVIAREIGDRQGKGAALNNLGAAYFELGEPHRAIKLYEQQLVIVGEIGDRRGVGSSLCNLGNAYAALGKLRRAVKMYEQALVIAHETGYRKGEVNVLNNLGLIYADLREPLRAIELYEQALDIAREIGDRRGESAALGNLGNTYAGLNESLCAIEMYKQQLDIALEISDRRGEANASWNLGSEYVKQNKLSCAIELIQVYVDFLREIDHPDVKKRTAYVDKLRARLADAASE